MQSLVDEEVALGADHLRGEKFTLLLMREIYLLALWTLVVCAVSGWEGSTTSSTTFLLLGEWSFTGQLHKRRKRKEVVVGASQMWSRYQGQSTTSALDRQLAVFGRALRTAIACS